MESWIKRACDRVGRNLAYQEWQAYFTDENYQKTCPQWPIDPGFLKAAETLAFKGDIDGAMEMFSHALELEPDLDLDPETETKHFAALGLVQQGERLAQQGDVDGAIAKFQEALEFDSGLDIEPETEAKRLAAPVYIEQGAQFAQEGNIEGATEKYSEAQLLDPALEISATSWSTLCWWGSLWDHAVNVMDACETAVESSPEDGNIVGSRGLARALTGDFDGAIEDFAFYVQWATDNGQDESDIAQREEWIAELEAGRNPFTEGVLEELRGE